MDLDQFKAKRDGEPRPAKRKLPPRHKRGEWFLKGPIPGAWLAQAAALRGRTLHVAMALWYLAGVEKSRTVKPTWAVWRRFGVSPDTGRRGLAALERVGLVTVDRHRGRCPVVTIWDWPRKSE